MAKSNEEMDAVKLHRKARAIARKLEQLRMDLDDLRALIPGDLQNHDGVPVRYFVGEAIGEVIDATRKTARIADEIAHVDDPPPPAEDVYAKIERLNREALACTGGC